MADTVREIVLSVLENGDDYRDPPETADEAIAMLNRGNLAFAELGRGGDRVTVQLSPSALGLPEEPGKRVIQSPFAAALGCADARVPLELVFGRSGNEIFVTRVAGNVPGAEMRGSLHYAVDHIPTVKVLLVLGHTRCGAITAAVDAMIKPSSYLEVVHDPPLRGIVDSLIASVRLADLALRDAYGPEVIASDSYREALIELSGLANAAVSATVLNNDVDHAAYFGIYQLSSRLVGIPVRDGWQHGLVPAPRDDAALAHLLTEAAAGLNL